MSVRGFDRYLVAIMSVIAFTTTMVCLKGVLLARDFYRQALQAQHLQTPVITGNVDSPIVFIGDSRIAQWSQHDIFSARYIGYPGASSHQIATQFDSELLGKNTSIVIIEAGVNDLRLAGVAPGRVKELVDESLGSLRHLVEDLVSHVDQVILLTVFPVAEPDLLRSVVWSDEVQQSIDLLNRSLSQTQWPSTVRVVDCDSALLALGGKAFMDTLHLTESGYDALNTLIEPLLAPLPAATATPNVREA